MGNFTEKEYRSILINYSTVKIQLSKLLANQDEKDMEYLQIIKTQLEEANNIISKCIKNINYEN